MIEHQPGLILNSGSLAITDRIRNLSDTAPLCAEEETIEHRAARSGAPSSAICRRREEHPLSEEETVPLLCAARQGNLTPHLRIGRSDHLTLSYKDYTAQLGAFCRASI